jgi:hypothetical protein
LLTNRSINNEPRSKDEEVEVTQEQSRFLVGCKQAAAVEEITEAKAEASPKPDKKK